MLAKASGRSLRISLSLSALGLPTIISMTAKFRKRKSTGDSMPSLLTETNLHEFIYSHK